MKVSGSGPRVGLTFDDVLLVPKFSDVLSRKDVSISSRFSRRIRLAVPIVSANMDTVTEASMAIAMARLGGLGVVHRFMPAEEQAAEVAMVKRSEGVVIEDPVTLGPGATVGDATELMKERHVGGIVIVAKGGRVAGLVTRRDLTFEDKPSTPLRRVMTPKARLVTARKGIGMERARDLLRDHKVEKLPLLDRSGRLAGLITARDLVKRKEYPLATKDSRGRLMVAAAVGVKSDRVRRAGLLLQAGADALVVDIAHGHSMYSVDTLKDLRKAFGDVELVAGNVATGKGATDLIRAGADAVKVGVGAGSICVTRVVTGSGVPQLTAIQDSAAAAKEQEVPVIADGGIRNPGDVTKALAAGADSVMVGSLFAGTEESPGPTVLRQGVRYKFTRGMASLGASMDRRRRERGDSAEGDDELLKEVVEEGVPEGVEGLIPYKGSVREVAAQLAGGLRSGMSYSGAHTVAELQANSEFIRITAAGQRESLPHDIQSVA